MVDFLMVSERLIKKDGIQTFEVYPKFKVKNPSADLMIKGNDFYAVWDERKGMWSTNEQDVIEIIDGNWIAMTQKTKQDMTPDRSVSCICGTRKPV